MIAEKQYAVPSLMIDPSLDPSPVRAGLVWGIGLVLPKETTVPPDWLRKLLSDVPSCGESWFAPERKAAVRSMLRFGTYKPAGRSKPSSEYLLAAALVGEFPLVNRPVDINNGISLRFGYPASIFDLALSGPEFCLRRGRGGENYVFNRTGQTIDLGDLLCVCRRAPGSGAWIPCGNPVKDAMETKVFDSARDVAAVIYAPAREPVEARGEFAGTSEDKRGENGGGWLETACSEFARLLREDCGASETGWHIR